MTNQKGFALPYVMFISLIVFIFVATNIVTFQNNLHVTNKIIENIKIETLFQMGYTNFYKDIESLINTEDTVTYVFPDGVVEITYFQLNDSTLSLYMNITTVNDTHYTVITQVELINA
ncbi:hypothetical protein ACFSTA_12305 [Ornithinibacillus salinisoli]|uniref:ComG operon protein 7 n=1 Tax=Ornithinibacillus salinisoli TaxID=1848459 RepID=A0ABW4W5C9_9BACI